MAFDIYQRRVELIEEDTRCPKKRYAKLELDIYQQYFTTHKKKMYQFLVHLFLLFQAYFLLRILKKCQN